MENNYQLHVTGMDTYDWAMEEVNLYQIQSFLDILRNDYPTIAIEIQQDDQNHQVEIVLSGLEEVIPIASHFPYFTSMEAKIASQLFPVTVLK